MKPMLLTFDTVGERLDRVYDRARLLGAILYANPQGQPFSNIEEQARAMWLLLGPILDDLHWIRMASERFDSVPAPTDDERHDQAERRKARKLAAVAGSVR